MKARKNFLTLGTISSLEQMSVKNPVLASFGAYFSSAAQSGSEGRENYVKDGWKSLLRVEMNFTSVTTFVA